MFSMSSYDDFLRAAKAEYDAALEVADRRIEGLEEQLRLIQAQIDHARSEKREAERVYYSAVVALAERRLAGEFGAEDYNGSGDRKAGNAPRVEEACRAVANPDDFTGADVESVLDPPINRSTLNSVLNRLAERGVLRVVEAGYKRKPTRYALVAMAA
jgi:hypothetical protein